MLSEMGRQFEVFHLDEALRKPKVTLCKLLHEKHCLLIEGLRLSETSC